MTKKGNVAGVKTQAVRVIRKYSGGQLRERSQLTLVATEDGRLVEDEFDVALACIVDDAHELAWLERADCQLMNKADKKWYQVVSERSITPLAFQGVQIDEGQLTDIRDGIYARAVEQAKNRKYREAKQGGAYDKLVWLACTAGAIALVAMTINVFAGRGDKSGALPETVRILTAGMDSGFILQVGGAVVLAIAYFIWRQIRQNKKKRLQRSKAVQETVDDRQYGQMPKIADRTNEEQKAREKQIAEKLESGELQHNVLLVDRGAYGLTYLEDEVIERLKSTSAGIGRQWRYGLDTVYWLEKKASAYIPVVVHETLGHLPGDLWDALQVDDVDMVYDMKRPQGLAKYAPYLIVLAISFFCLIVAMNN